MEKILTMNDEFGPEKIVEIYVPETSLQAYVVIDNVAAGPAIGGVRMAPDVTREECFRLARAMTLKNAMAGLAHGGAKAAIVADPHMNSESKEKLVRSFAYAMRDLIDYIPGPDMGTDEVCMAQIRDVTGRSVGLPRAIGGIPLDDIGSTGYGLAVALEVAEHHLDFSLAEARVAIQGFGSVGQHAAINLADRGARIVAVADSQGARHAPAGFDLNALLTHKALGHSVTDFAEGAPISMSDLIAVPCDVWIPAARPDVITLQNVASMHTQVIVQGANIPISLDAESWLAKQGVTVIPDFVANAGGVICAAVEFHQGSERDAVTTIKEKISNNVDEVLAQSIARSELPRRTALDIAQRRVREAMTFRKSW